MNANRDDFISVHPDPAPLSPAFDARHDLANLDYIRVLVEDDDVLQDEGFDIDRAISKIIQPDQETLLDCIDNWIASGPNRAHIGEQLKGQKVLKMKQWVRSMFSIFKRRIRELILKDE